MMSTALPDRPDLEPSGLEGASLGRSRKGFEPTEVRSLLGRGADALRVWAARDDQLVQRVEELSKKLDEAEEFDEERVTELLGAETARIVAAAREVATELRTRAETESTDLLASSRAEAESTSQGLIEAATADREIAASARQEAEAAAERILAEATETAGETVGTARREAEELTAAATTEAEESTSTATAESEKVRADAAEESGRRIAAGQERQDVLVASASAVLEERSKAAEAAAAKILAAAEEEASLLRSTAAEELAAARTDAERLRADTRVESESELEAAREEGRRMVAEAREVRKRMLRDLAERSRAGRQKVEAAKVARAGMLEAIREAAGRLDETLGALDESDRSVRRLADAAAAAVPDDVDTVVRELESELEVADDPGSADDPGVPDDPGVADDPGSPDDPEVTHGDPVSGGEELSDGQVTTEVDGDGGAGGHTAAPADGAAPQDTSVREDDSAPEVSPSAGDATPDDAADPDPDADSDRDSGSGTGDDDARGNGTMASVHDLFERLRSDEDGSEDAVGNDDSADGDPGDAATAFGAVPGPSGSVGGLAVATETVEVSTALVADSGSEGDEGVLDRRDELLAPAQRLLGRNLKRLLSDEQNDVLDRARRTRRQRAELEDLLGDGAEATFVAALAEPFQLAAAAGAQMWSELAGSPRVEPTAEDVADPLARQVADLLELRRARVREALDHHAESGADASELVDQMRAAYRELRTASVPEFAADLSIGGFTSGTRAAAGSDAAWRWIPDNGGLPCADAEDNALAGTVTCGDAFPTGDVVPPAHSGCRCIVVPVS